MTKRPFHIDRLLEAMLKSAATELRPSAGSLPRTYVNVQFQTIGSRILDRDDIEQLMRSVTPDARQLDLRTAEQTWFWFDFGDLARFYVRACSWRTDPELVIRPATAG